MWEPSYAAAPTAGDTEQAYPGGEISPPG